VTTTNIGLPRVLKVREIAEVADAPISTIQQALRDGRFPNAFKLGGETAPWRVPVEDVERFLRGEAPPAPDRPRRSGTQPTGRPRGRPRKADTWVRELAAEFGPFTDEDKARIRDAFAAVGGGPSG
jgi:predicted DNA-binding transcriptional regulator AlpA